MHIMLGGILESQLLNFHDMMLFKAFPSGRVPVIFAYFAAV